MDPKTVHESGRVGDGLRRPYEPPAVIWEEDFLPYVYSTCMKMPGMTGCSGVRRS